MHFLKQFWRFAHFSFCIWFYVFIPGSHCFAIDKLNGTAICTVHFRSIWTAPLRFSIRRSWAGSKVTAAKLDPKKSNLKNKFQSSTFRTGFSFFYMFSHVFTFFPSAFSKHIFSQFVQVHFQNTFFHFFILFYFFFFKCEKCGWNAFWKCAWKKCEKMRFENVKNMRKNVKHVNKRQLKRSCFLAPCSIFPR